MNLANLFTACCAFPTKGWEAFYGDAINGAFEEDYTYVVGNKLSVETGNIDSKEYDLRLQQAIEVAENKIKIIPKDTYYVPKLVKLKEIKAQRTCAQKANMRMAPYGILLYGSSSVGKSCMANAIVRYVLKINGFNDSKDVIISMNASDEFQSELRTTHQGIILDDLCNANPETDSTNATKQIIQFMNNMPTSAVSPIAEHKGNIMMEPRVVLATTNVKHLHAAYYSCEPVSIARRFNSIITQEVRDRKSVV